MWKTKGTPKQQKIQRGTNSGEAKRSRGRGSNIREPRNGLLLEAFDHGPTRTAFQSLVAKGAQGYPHARHEPISGTTGKNPAAKPPAAPRKPPGGLTLGPGSLEETKPQSPGRLVPGRPPA